MSLLPNPHHPISIREARRFAWRVFKRRVGLFTAVLSTMLGAWAALEVVVISGQRLGVVLWVVAHLAFFMVFAGLQVGFVKTCLSLYDGGEPTFADTFTHLTSGPKFFAEQMIYLLTVVAGLVLLVVPGLYLAVRYGLFGFCMVADDDGWEDSFEKSAILTTRTKTLLLALFVSLFIFNIIGASLLGIGLLVTVPLSTLTVTAVYRQLARTRNGGDE